MLPELIGMGRGRVVVGAARALITLLFAATWLGWIFRSHMGPVELAFIPICATIWIGADLLTAFLLLSQFNVDGKVSLLAVAVGYISMALLTLPYLLLYPNIFFASNAETIQVSPWLFTIWHLVFPLCLATAQVIGFRAGAPAVSRERIPFVLAATVTLAVVASAAIASTVWILRDALPVIIVIAHQRFSPLYSRFLGPLIIGANAAALLTLVGIRRSRGPLRSWLAIVLLAATLDGFLDTVTLGRYSVSWYIGQFEATFATSALLLLLVFDVARLYRGLFDVASHDSLTGLANRNGLQNRMPGVLAHTRSGKGDVALLVVDIDHFKKYNDAFGHPAGDEALRRIATILEHPLRRASDVVARIGGEEFIVLLPSTPAKGARLVAERIRAEVEAAGIANPSAPLGKVTVSIGIGVARNSSETTAEDLFSIADQALYRAKEGGRNRVVLGAQRPDAAAAGATAFEPAAGAAGWHDLQLKLKQLVTRN
jgi:diguanylate cyclase (GGDEF)-like protein